MNRHKQCFITLVGRSWQAMQETLTVTSTSRGVNGRRRPAKALWSAFRRDCTKVERAKAYLVCIYVPRSLAVR